MPMWRAGRDVGGARWRLWASCSWAVGCGLGSDQVNYLKC